MRLAALISGGKDSIYAAYEASKGNEVVCIITFKSKRADSYMFHIPNVELVKLQAKSMSLPLIFAESSGIKEKELKDIKDALSAAIKKYKIQGVVSGALASNYQKERIDKICMDLGIKSIAPLWHIEPKKYLKELIDNNFKVIITGVAAEGLDESWLGRELDKGAIEDLTILNAKIKFHLGFEGGEAETFVLDCPIFKKRLMVEEAEKQMESKYCGQYSIKKIRFADK